MDGTSTLRDTDANRAKIGRLRLTLEDAFARSLRHGFYGEIRLAMVIQNGTIQDFRVALERRER